MRLDDTPAGRIARLDASLAAHGQAVLLRRYTGPANAPLSTWTDKTVRAKGVPANAAELAAGINMTGRRLILSPTDVGAGVPQVGRDAFMIRGTKRVIEVWSPIELGNEVVRIEAQIKGN